jgi:hypothetical protein
MNEFTSSRFTDVDLGLELPVMEEDKKQTSSRFIDVDLGLELEVEPVSQTIQALQPTSSAETINDLMQDNNYAVVGNYMKQRFGMTEDTHGRQEVIDSFVNHMRKFNFGQSVTTGTELAYLNKAEEANKLAAGQAYQLFDNMKGAFSEEYSFAQKADAVGDYARALIVDPVNVLSLGFGKLITGGATKVAANLAKDAVIKQVKKELTKKGIKNVSSKTAQAQAQQIERRIIGKIIKGEKVRGVAKGAFAEGVKKSTKKEILATTAFDSASAVTIDAVYQKALQQGGVQTDYNVVQGAVTGIGGVFGGSLAYGLSLLNKAPHTEESLPLAMSFFDGAAVAEANAKKLASTTTLKSNKATLKNINAKALQKSLNKSATASERWAKKVLKGDALRRQNGINVEPRTDEWLAAFLHGSKDGKFKGIKTILEDFNIELVNEGDKFANFTDFLTENIKILPKDAKTEVAKLYKNTMANVPEFNTTLNKGLNVLSSKASEWGREGQTLSKLSQDLKLANRFAPDKTASQKLNTVVNTTLDPTPKTIRDKIVDGTSSMQQNLIRMLITHPGTTALNVVGWANATSMQSVTDILRGALYGGRSVAEMAIGRNTNATEFANKSKLMFTLQKQKAMNLVNPFATQQSALDFLAANPKAQKELFRYMSGGIELDDVYKQIGIQIGDIGKPSTAEKVMDFAQTMYGVKAQDMYTKTQEFMYALDKQVRIKYGKTYSEFLEDPDLYKVMKGDTYAEIQTIAVQDALRNVYAKPFGKNPKGLLSFGAKVIEDMRKYPIVGAMIPFGQFFNNTLGHMFDHTGISLVHKYAAGTTRDPLDLLTKSAIGLSLIGVTTAREYDNMEEGLAWFEERRDDGSIRNRMYDFPFSFYKAMGRMGAHFYRDGEVPEDLVKELVTLFGPGQLTRQLGDSAKISFDLLVDASSGEDRAVRDALGKLVQDTASMYLSGYSRPFDPVNTAIALGRGENFVAVDRNQGSKWLNNSTRYVDQIYTALSGAELAPEKFNALTDARGTAPIGRIFGYRENPGQTHIQKMFNQIGKPQWRTEIKSFIPETQNHINKIVFHFLEQQAEYALATPAWKNGNNKQRKQLLGEVLRKAKKRTTDLLEGSLAPEDSRTNKLYKISKKGSGVTKEDVDKALTKLDIDVDITELDENQLDFLMTYLELQKDEVKKLKMLGTR